MSNPPVCPTNVGEESGDFQEDNIADDGVHGSGSAGLENEEVLAPAAPTLASGAVQTVLAPVASEVAPAASAVVGQLLGDVPQPVNTHSPALSLASSVREQAGPGPSLTPAPTELCTACATSSYKATKWYS